MNRSTFLGFTFLVLAGLAPAQAAELRDAKGRFSVSIPAGWSSEVPTQTGGLTVVLAKPDAEGLVGAACVGLYLDMPSTRTATQAELNAAVEGQLTESFWKGAMQDGNDPTFKVLSTGKRDSDGRRIHNAVFSGTVVDGEKKTAGQGKVEIHFIPGSMHSVMCVTEAAAFASHSPAFETIFTSYAPSVEAIVAQAPSGTASALTLFARTAQSGAAQVVSRDTADVRSAGLNTAAASLTVDGSEAWQVCSGVGYTGACVTVAGPAGAPFEVLSVRRNNGPSAVAVTALRRSLTLSGFAATR